MQEVPPDDEEPGSGPDHPVTGDSGSDQGPPAGAGLGYEEFVVARGPALVRLARGLLRDPYLAEDVVQDVLARAMLQWSRVSTANDVDAYVRRMVVNACTSWFRRAARRERVTDQALVLDRPVGDSTDQYVDRDELVTLLRRLPAKQRAVLVLRHYEGLPDADIASTLGCSEVTVRSNAHRGLARLRELMAASGAGGRGTSRAPGITGRAGTAGVSGEAVGGGEDRLSAGPAQRRPSP